MMSGHPISVFFLGLLTCLAVGLAGFASGTPQEVIPDTRELSKPTVSSGQPATTFWSLGALGGLGREPEPGTFQAYLKMSKGLAFRPLSILNLEGTAGMETRGHRVSWSMGGFINLFWLSVGARYRPGFEERKLVPVVAIENALGRGQTLGLRRAELRVEWSPRTLAVGLNLNLNEQAGQYRPSRAHASVPKGKVTPIPEVDPRLMDADALSDLKHAVLWIDRFVTARSTGTMFLKRPPGSPLPSMTARFSVSNRPLAQRFA